MVTQNSPHQHWGLQQLHTDSHSVSWAGKKIEFESIAECRACTVINIDVWLVQMVLVGHRSVDGHADPFL